MHVADLLCHDAQLNVTVSHKDQMSSLQGEGGGGSMYPYMYMFRMLYTQAEGCD